MKKVISLAVLLLLATPLLADDFGFRFGLKFSPNLSWFQTETRDYNNDGLRVGYSYGLIVDYEFAENYAVTTGLNFLRTGGKLTYVWEDAAIKASTYKYRHLEIPLALKLHTTEIGYITYYGKFGLGMGFRTSAYADEQITESPAAPGPLIENEDVKDDTAFLRAGLILGAGLEYSFGGNTAILIGITFHRGFSNILNKSKKGTDYFSDNKPSANNSFVELTLGVMF